MPSGFTSFLLPFNVARFVRLAHAARAKGLVIS
jgi:hypothetical protein